MSILELMAAPFVECLILVAIHTYLGIHVLKRRVIFVDLALAQIAALGTTVGFLFGIMPDTPAALLYSMAFTFLGAIVFAVTRFRHERVPQEAVIGLTYAVSCALAVLVVEKTRGAEHLKDILVGNLLWVKWSDVGLAAAVYAAIGVLHFVFRRQFLAISEDPQKAYLAGLSVRFWDFLFYLTFGVVITFSTRVAGVLLVFVFLVAPAILAFIITRRLLWQLLIGWGTGTLVTVLGLYLSWVLDLPSGPAVIAFYGAALVLGGGAVALAHAANRPRAWRVAFGATSAVLLATLAVWGMGRWLGSTGLAVSADALAVEKDVEHDELTVAARVAQGDQKRRAALIERTRRCVGVNKVDRHLAYESPEGQLRQVRAALDQDRRKGLEFLLLVLADDEMPLLYREEAGAVLSRALGERMGYDPQLAVGQNAAAIRGICERIRAMKGFRVSAMAP
jgi:zinc/manganese transport system permease protein